MKRHTVEHCEACGRRRWIFRGWIEHHPVRRDDCSVHFCSQGHSILFQIGWVDEVLKAIMLPAIMEQLNRRNVLSTILRKS